MPPVPLRRPFRGFVCLFLGFCLFVCSFARAQLKRAGSALFGDGVQRTPGRLEAFGSDAGAHVHSSIRPGLHRTSRAIQTIACCATATGYKHKLHKASDRMKVELLYVGKKGVLGTMGNLHAIVIGEGAALAMLQSVAAPLPVIQIRLEVYPATRASNCVLTRQSPASSTTPSAMPCWASVSGFVVGHVLSGCTRTGRAWDH